MASGVSFPPPLEYNENRREVGDEEDQISTQTEDDGLIGDAINVAQVIHPNLRRQIISELHDMMSTEYGEGEAAEEEDSTDDDDDDYYYDDDDDSDDGEDGNDDHNQEEDEEEDQEESKGRVDNGEEKGKDNAVVVSEDDLVLPTCPICLEEWTSEGPHRICCTPCGHVYGRLCLETWLSKFEYKGKCPQCKRKFIQSQIINLYAPRIIVPNDDLEKEVASLREKNELLTLEKARLIENLHKQTDDLHKIKKIMGVMPSLLKRQMGLHKMMLQMYKWHISQGHFSPLPSPKASFRVGLEEKTTLDFDANGLQMALVFVVATRKH